MPKKTEIDHYSDKEALDFHLKGKSGKIEINRANRLQLKEIYLLLTSWCSRSSKRDSEES